MAVPAEITGNKAQFGVGMDDVLLFPLAVIAVFIRLIGKMAISLLISILDFTFPLVMQLLRFPLFTVRILGDACVAVVKALATLLPVAEQTRSKWQVGVGEKWTALRGSISYRAFEQALHHLFEAGMAKVFRTCRKLTPRQALWVIVAAALWLPVSFGLATVMHAWLLAYATVLPAWMQFLHPLATFVAKSKLLVLPVYPAAWPQARRHPVVQGLGRGYDRLRTFYLVRKAGHRYRQLERARQEIFGSAAHTCAKVGITGVSEKIWNGSVKALGWSLETFHWSLRWTFSSLSNLLLIGPVLRSYAVHYAAVEQRKAQKASERISSLYEEWSIKFSAEYYEAKEREKELRAQADLALCPSLSAPPQESEKPISSGFPLAPE
jgi:hypothetical protein